MKEFNAEEKSAIAASLGLDDDCPIYFSLPEKYYWTIHWAGEMDDHSTHYMKVNDISADHSQLCDITFKWIIEIVVEGQVNTKDKSSKTRLKTGLRYEPGSPGSSSWTLNFEFSRWWWSPRVSQWERETKFGIRSWGGPRNYADHPYVSTP